MKNLNKLYFAFSKTLCILSSLLIVGCNNHQNENQSQIKDSTTAGAHAKDSSSTATLSAASLKGNLNVLLLSKKQLKDLSDGHKRGDKRKLVFKFYFDDDNKNSPTLEAFATENGNKFLPGIDPQQLTATNQSTLDLDDTKTKYLGDQELTLDSIDDYITGCKPSGNFDLIFSPDIKAHDLGEASPGTTPKSIPNIIYYKVTLSTCPGFTGSLQTNPSPPRNAR